MSISAVDTVADADLDLSRERLISANINPDTYLATDYLNHYNEVVMLIEMLSAMPDCVEDVLHWSPLDYTGYFAVSHFKEKDLAIAAYLAAEPAIREALLHIVTEADERILHLLEMVGEARSSHEPAAFDSIAFRASSEIRPLLDRANAVINGTPESVDPMVATEGPTAQAEIDALFD